jgi:hypothetical protein
LPASPDPLRKGGFDSHDSRPKACRVVVYDIGRIWRTAVISGFIVCGLAVASLVHADKLE